jgi:hypothetical protein
LHQKLGQLEPLKYELEPELERLRQERRDWLASKQQLESEVDHLRMMDNLIQELNKELGKLTKHSSSSKESADVTFFSQTPSQGAFARSLPSAYNGNDSPMKMWNSSKLFDFGSSCFAYLRQLSPLLYELVYAIHQNSQQKEMSCQEAVNLIQSLSKDVKHLSSSLDDERKQYQHSQNHHEKLVEDYRKKLTEMESEILELREQRSVLHQIRYAVQSQTSSKEMSKVSDRQLPDLISRLIIQHAHSALSYEDMKSSIERLQSENNSLRSAHQDLQASSRKLQSEVENLHAEMKNAENAYLLKESNLKQEVNKAVDLAEKQITVTQLLESKLESSTRESQLKSSQLQTIKQREESLRRRIYQILESYSESIGISSKDISKMVPAETSVSDLLDYLSDILRSFAYKLSSQIARDLVTSSSFASSSSPGKSPTSVVKKAIDTSSEMSAVAHDEIGDSLMLSPDYDLSNESSTIDAYARNPHINPIKMSDIQLQSSHQQLQKLLQQQTSSKQNQNLPSYQNDYGVSTSKEIQQRLLKAQQAINAMKTH